jgi:3-isopropylmalate/(R)-2-methylmalate dehydratase small subunit
MRPFTRLTSRLAPLPGSNIDTDQIIPASYLKITDRQGLAEGLFANWRYDQDGKPNPEFILNRPEYREARILITGANFGSGSSREHAPWALQDHGFEAIISTSFADIFRANAAKNGLLTATVAESDHATLMHLAEQSPASEITVDLTEKSISSSGIDRLSFEIDAFARHCLLNGVDQLGFLLERVGAIEAYEARHPQRVATLSPGAGPSR